jgi:hypothetical protein
MRPRAAYLHGARTGAKARVGVVAVHYLEPALVSRAAPPFEVIIRALEIAGVEFIGENGGGARL